MCPSLPTSAEMSRQQRTIVLTRTAKFALPYVKVLELWEALCLVDLLAEGEGVLDVFASFTMHTAAGIVVQELALPRLRTLGLGARCSRPRR
jgi:hypothetical protein